MSGWQELDARSLRAWPLPPIAADADKEERGRVLVIGGSREIAGAVQLAAVAALRAGAGKLVIATAQSVAPHMTQVVPEARVIGLPENGGGSFDDRAVEAIGSAVDGAAVVLAGPGMMDPAGDTTLLQRVLARCRAIPLVLDAYGMDVIPGIGRCEQPVLLTPHAGEMAHLLGIGKEEVLAQPEAVVRHAASQWNAVVALKGATTWIANPRGDCWRHAAAHPGLATSGSGDVLAGLVSGFAARGVSLEQACAWGVVMHALAGESLARRLGPVGYLARELPMEVPVLMRKMPLRRSRAPRAG